MQPLYSFLADRPVAFALAGAAFILILLVLRRSRRPWLSHVQKKPLLTANETEFLGRLRRALPAFEVFPQVSFAAIITDDGRLTGKARWHVRARFDRKMVDYVICERRTLEIVALVELDDRSHTASADRQRDAITKAAGYKTIRFQSKQKPSQAEIAALFQHARAWTSTVDRT